MKSLVRSLKVFFLYIVREHTIAFLQNCTVGITLIFSVYKNMPGRQWYDVSNKTTTNKTDIGMLDL